ncbi:hypothetical protein [Kibdelosporangium philippinense]|uniref:hypothetical protein n=1 Tax=Kibdelosporangium philippinense TaxID=211113 RepID=UPI0027DF85B4|nr:hypothetical protein [Kibdelosporangium philippinense]
MGKSSISVPGSGVGKSEVHEQSGFAANELGGQAEQRVIELVDRVRFAESCKGIAAPSG